MARQAKKSTEKVENTNGAEIQSNSDFIEEVVVDANQSKLDDVKNEPVENTKPLNLEEKITVKNIASWPVSFSREETIGDVVIPANGFMRFTRNEVILQVNKGNRLFTGSKLNGDHPTIFIDDEPTRIELGYENQIVLTEQLVNTLMATTDFNTFVSEVKKYIITRGEKYSFAKSLKEKGFNDHQKIVFIESYTGYYFNR